MPLFEVGTYQSFIYNKPAFLKKNRENGDYIIFSKCEIYLCNK